MTDREIIKALECCGKSGWLFDCDGCPCYDPKEDIQTSECQERLMKNALSLINRQKEEIGHLEAENKLLINRNCELAGKGEKAIITFVKSQNHLKSEARREFADRLEPKLANNTDITGIGYQSVIEVIRETIEEMESESDG